MIAVETVRAHDNEYPLADGSVKAGKEPGDRYLVPDAVAAQLGAQGLVKQPDAPKKA